MCAHNILCSWKMYGIDMYTTMTSAYLQYYVLRSVCTELKQINNNVYSVLSKFGKYPQFSLFFPS